MGVEPGAMFAGFQIVRRIGIGGMGEVYLVQHPRLPRLEALKVLPRSYTNNDEYRQRFQREAELAVGVWHPNLVALHDRGEADGRLWISMDYIDGPDAAELLRTRYPAGMPVDQVVAIVSAIASALDAIHDRGLLHRDVKPANILCSKLGSTEQRIALTDFGVAREINDTVSLTAANMTVGTAAYAAPEQLVGESFDGQADQYALAATAFHLLTGSELFPHPNAAMVITRHLNAIPPRPSDIRPELAGLDGVLARALAKDPGQRYPRCADFAAALADQARAMPIRAASPLPGYTPLQQLVAPAQSAKPITRRRQWGSLLTTAIVIAAASVGTYAAVRHFSHPGDNLTAGAPAQQVILDGTYRLNYLGAQQLHNGAPDPWPSQTGNAEVSFWAFRSHCSPSGCVATATALDKGNLKAARTPSRTTELRFTDGRWDETGTPTSVDHPLCLRNDAGPGPGTDTEVSTWNMTPQPDGVLKGVQTTTVLTNECGLAGSVIEVPFNAVRIGEVPDGVELADPAAVPAAPPSPAPMTDNYAATLDGMYRIDFDYAQQIVDGKASGSPITNKSQWWAFRSLCTDKGCAATGVAFDESNQRQGNGIAEVLTFTEGRWQDTPYLQPPQPCPPGNPDADVSAISRSLIPQPDGSLQGIESMTVLTNQCGSSGTVYKTPITATRVGDVPPTVTLADPAKFLPAG
ncbi:MAG: serine/threonine-protein kinase [Mycobacterium sp.]